MALYLGSSEKLRFNLAEVKSSEIIYSYNGVQLPTLPEWDSVTYPYALICKISNNYFLMCSAVKTEIRSGSWYCPVDTVFYFGVTQEGERQWTMGEELLEEPAGDKGVLLEEILWSNYDLVDENGDVTLAASDPVPVCKNEYTNVAYLCRYNIVNTPIAYLYNGVRLLIPDYDKEKYPYAVLLYSVSGKYYEVRLSQSAITYEQSDGGVGASLVINPSHRWIRQDGDTWKESNELTTDLKLAVKNYVIGSTVHNVVWSNHDILDSSGAVYLAGSDPVPVYE